MHLLKFTKLLGATLAYAYITNEFEWQLNSALILHVLCRTKSSTKTGGIHTAQKSPRRTENFRQASADYGGTINDDLFESKTVSENKKSSLRTVK